MTVNDLAIRPMRSADAGDLSRMVTALAAFHGDTATATEQDFVTFCLGRKRLATILVACADGRAVGFSACRDWANLVRGSKVRHIDLIFVDAEYRHLGIGAALIRAVARAARDAGCNRVTVGAAADNELAARFYLKLGFTVRKDHSTQYALTDLGALP